MPPPVRKRRRIEPVGAVEEVTFDPAARQEYLTGFHKRKVQRTKAAQDAAEKRARAERIEARKKLREERKADLEKHVAEVNALLQPAAADPNGQFSSESNSEWEGVEDDFVPPPLDHEAEYVDEDRYTTVTVEDMDVSREGLLKASVADDNGVEAAENDENKEPNSTKSIRFTKKPWTKENPREKPKKKRKKFRYESKAERKVTRMKEHSKNRKQAKERKAR